MSILAVTRSILQCDGCGAQHGAPQGHRTAMEARAAAFADGWRFPPQATINGRQSSATSDVCPACVDGWQPQRRAQRHGYQLHDGTVRHQ